MAHRPWPLLFKNDRFLVAIIFGLAALIATEVLVIAKGRDDSELVGTPAFFFCQAETCASAPEF